jgi:iron complex transport system substrate-binding protein
LLAADLGVKSNARLAGRIVRTWGRGFFDGIGRDPRWARAVREQRVYLVPAAPRGWLDRSPSLNRTIGRKWLAGLF